MDENNYVQRRGSSIIVAKHPHFLPFEIVTLIFDAIYKKPQEGVSSHPIPRNANYLSFGWDITLFKCIRHTNNLLSFKYPKLFVFDIDF